jgi:dienelactone hydrolase
MRCTFVAAVSALAVFGATNLYAGWLSGSSVHTVDQSIQVPIDDGTGRQVMMQGHICRPVDTDKPQLVIINHGSPPSPKDRPHERLTSCDNEAVQWFVKRHYAVVTVLRLGYGTTGGPWTETYGHCHNPDFYKAGMETARQIDAMVNYVTTLPNVEPDNVVVIGQSAGGWGTIAYSSMPHPKVAAIIDMAGGRGGHQPGNNGDCDVDKLIEAAGQFGKTAKTEMLWIYTGNDSYFPPSIADPMLQAYLQAGGQARLYRPDRYGDDGHGLFFGRGGSQIWGPVVESYLAAIKQGKTL